MARRRIRQRLPAIASALLILVGGGALYYQVFFKPIRDAAPPAAVAVKLPPPPPPPTLISERPASVLATEDPREKSALPVPPVATQPAMTPPSHDSAPALTLMRAGMAALGRGDVIDARGKLSEALVAGLPASETAEARSQLSRLADQTILCPTILPNDPHVIAHVVQSGETLAKIAKRYGITANLMARINAITDKNRVRAGQRLKVIQGPFSAVVHRGTFDIEVFLGRTLVRHFKVGLGTDGSTPPGKWKVSNKLVNPTYYPPRGGDIMAADDPKNPLGERWIGLIGIEGEAVGQERYGIHGTIEPESIGKNMSLGCVRLLNPDVELLFDLLVEEQSTVTIR